MSFRLQIIEVHPRSPTDLVEMKLKPVHAAIKRWCNFIQRADSSTLARSVCLALIISGAPLLTAGCNAEKSTDNKAAPQAGSAGLGGARGLKLCNTTSSRVGVAVGYKSTKGWVSEGWWNIASHTCETVVTGKLINRYYYLHVLDYDQSGEWSGKLYMCTDDKPFTISKIENCAERGFKRTGFFEVDTGEEPSWTVRLEETKNIEAKDQ